METQISIFDIFEPKPVKEIHSFWNDDRVFNSLKTNEKELVLKELEKVARERFPEIDFVHWNTKYEASIENGSYISYGMVHQKPVIIDGKKENNIVQFSDCIVFKQVKDGFERLFNDLQVRTVMWNVRARIIRKCEDWITKRGGQ